MERVIVDLYDAVDDATPFRSFSDVSEGTTFIDLNPDYADRAARVVIRRGINYHPGDHVRLLDDVQPDDTDMVTVDPLVCADVDLNSVNFADKAAALHFQLNPSGQFRIRADLYDETGKPYPNLSLYDWETPSGTPIDLNRLHFADKAAWVHLARGSGFHSGDQVRLLDEFGSPTAATLPINPLKDADVDLNAPGWADRAAGLAFELDMHQPEAKIIELVNDKHKNLECAPVEPDPRLMEAARFHSEDLASHPGLYDAPPPAGRPPHPGHYGSDGSLGTDEIVVDPVTGAEKSIPGRITIAMGSTGHEGENVAYGYPAVEALFEAWLSETPPNDVHRRNILNCNFKFIGVGIAQSPDGTRYYTVDFFG